MKPPRASCCRIVRARIAHDLTGDSMAVHTHIAPVCMTTITRTAVSLLVLVVREVADYLTNLVATVVDFQNQTTAVKEILGPFATQTRPGLDNLTEPRPADGPVAR